MELVMPESYVEIDEQEMMYLDGGANGWWNSTSFIGTCLDTAFTLVSGISGAVSLSAMRKFIKNYRGTLTRVAKNTLLKYIGTTGSSLISTAFNIALTVSGTSIGGLIAEGLDRADGRNNNYVFG